MSLFKKGSKVRVYGNLGIINESYVPYMRGDEAIVTYVWPDGELIVKVKDYPESAIHERQCDLVKTPRKRRKKV